MASRTVGVVFALLFALGFGAGGVFGIASLFGQLDGWWQARGWPAVPATVLSAELKAHHDDSTTYEATATYRYVVDGRTYEGTRIGFSKGSDNVGSWQQDQYARLNAARRDGRSIDVWVDPAEPSRSVVDRKLRLAMVALTLPFATLFPMVSIGALWALIRILRTPAQEIAAPAKPKPNEREIRSDARRGAWMWWLLATFWNLIALPVAFVMVPELYGRSWAWLLVMIFPIVGLFLVWAAARQTFLLIRHGEITLRLSPMQPRLGEPFTAQATFTKIPNAGEFVFKLLCEEVDTRGDSNSSRTVWKQEHAVQTGGTYAAATFSPPADLPPSEPNAPLYHRWRVLLAFPHAKDERGFDVTIAPGDGTPSSRGSDRREAGVVDAGSRSGTEAIGPVLADPEKIARVRRAVKLAMTVVVALMLLAIFWNVFSGLPFFRQDARATQSPRQQVERADPPGSADLALFRAAQRKDAAREVAEALANGASVNALNDWGATPLLVASRLSTADVVEALIHAGSDINFSVRQDNEYRGRTPLMNAARSGRGENVRLLLDAGADALAFESHGWSAAHYAAHQGNLDGLRALREHGVSLDLHSPVSRGETPLMIAARFGKLDAIRELIALGADPKAIDRHGENAYAWAKYFNQPDAMRVLSAYQ